MKEGFEVEWVAVFGRQGDLAFERPSSPDCWATAELTAEMFAEVSLSTGLLFRPGRIKLPTYGISNYPALLEDVTGSVEWVTAREQLLGDTSSR